MARSAITLTDLSVNAAVAWATEVEISAADGASLDVGGKTDKVMLVILNNYAGSKDVTIKAGANPPAFRADLGDLTITFAQDAQKCIVLESARFVQSDGKIYIDFAASMTGHLWAYRLPAVI